jgi:DeoR family suf operon transcriptional repressor
VFIRVQKRKKTLQRKPSHGISTRQHILEYIQERRSVTVDELSKILHMTPANARHHLSALQSQGLVETTRMQSGPGKGRPAQVFTPALYRLEHNLGQLSIALIGEMKALMTMDEWKKHFNNIASRMATPADSNIISTIKPVKSLTQRLLYTVQRLNEFHYRARWEAHHEAPRIILEHCPYTAIMESHPELCQLDTLVLEKLLGEPVKQIAMRSKSSSGCLLCIFRLA